MNGITGTIGSRLRLRRQLLGYSQEQTAEKADLHPTYIGQVERGEKNVTIESLEKICIALNYPMEELFEKIVGGEHSNVYALKAYNIILAQPPEDQKLLLDILEQTIVYKNTVS